jgi:hypothetical protein
VAQVHDGLSKSTAHFTYRTDHLFNAGEDFLPALGLVLRILQRRFFDPLQEVRKTHATYLKDEVEPSTLTNPAPRGAEPQCWAVKIDFHKRKATSES